MSVLVRFSAVRVTLTVATFSFPACSSPCWLRADDPWSLWPLTDVQRHKWQTLKGRLWGLGSATKRFHGSRTRLRLGFGDPSGPGQAADSFHPGVVRSKLPVTRRRYSHRTLYWVSKHFARVSRRASNFCTPGGHDRVPVTRKGTTDITV